MRLTDILTPNCVKVPLDAATRDAAIEELIELLWQNGRIADREALRQSVMQRERARSTGIGRELAVPHGKSAGCDRLVMAVGKPREPIDFAGIDGRPVRLIVLLASPLEQSGPHVQALARISRLMLTDSFRQAVLDAPTAADLFSVIARHDP